MKKFAKYLRSEFEELDLHELLQQSCSVLLGVSAEAQNALKKININTVFDLGASWLFANATTLSEVNQITRLVDSLDVEQTNLLKPNAIFESAEDISDLGLEFLQGITNTQATDLKNALDIITIREFAFWPPRLTAHQLVSGHMTTTDEVIDEGEILRPRMGEYPTERVYYKSLAMLHMEVDEQQTPLSSPISLNPAVVQPASFGKIAVGVLLNTSQSWYAKGVTLGHMLHSLALAPGEATRIALVDWSRKTSTSVTEDIQESERLDNSTEHARAISEVQNAVATEMQEGESMSSGWASSTSTAEGGAQSSGLVSSVLGTGFSDSYSEQSATTRSRASSSSWSNGSREIASEMSQNINDRTEQHANSVRNRRATAVKEVSQSEHESVSTRIVANYNHMHALTIQYYEVVQVYKVTSQLHDAQRCLFIPFEYLDFNTPNAMDIVERFRGILVRAALTNRAQNLLIDIETMVAIKPVKKFNFPFLDIATTGNDVVMAAMRRENDSSATSSEPAPPDLPGLNIRDRILDNRTAILKISNTIGRSPSRKGATELYLPDETELIGITFDNLNIKSVRIDRPGFSSDMNTFSVDSESGSIDLPGGMPLYSIEEIHMSKADDAKTEGTMTLLCTYKDRSFRSNAMLVDLKKGTAMQKVVTFQTDRIDREKELLEHLQANRAYYSKEIFRSLDTATLVMLMSPFTWNGISLINQVEPKPITIAGNYLVFKAPVAGEETTGIFEGETNKLWRDIVNERGIDTKILNTRIIPIPTGGVFAEAVLGRSNSAEKLDITRFWNWQDSPIPLQPTEIAPVSLGSRGTSDDLTPGHLSSPVLNIVNPTSLPDPAGLSASLGAIANANLFRDMSGLAGTQSLTEAAIKETIAAAGQAGQLATTNLQTEAQKQVALSQIAADIAKAAMGIPPEKSTKGISADGAKVNLGRDMDKRGVSGAGGKMDTSTPGASPGNSGGTTEGDSNGSGGGDGSKMLMSGSSREAAYADHAALGYSPGGLGALSKLVGGSVVPAKLTTRKFESRCEKILKEMYPKGQMDGVKVERYSKNKNPILKKYSGYGAWTNSSTCIFVNDLLDDPNREVELIYTLKHESIHILQFQKNAGNAFTFLDMLKYELKAYPDTEKWLNGQVVTDAAFNAKPAVGFLNQNQLTSIKPTAKGASTTVKNIEKLKNEFFVNKNFDALANNDSLKSLVDANSSEERCALIAMVHKDGLPPIKKKKPYTVKQLYTQNPDAKTFTELGYPP